MRYVIILVMVCIVGCGDHSEVEATTAKPEHESGDIKLRDDPDKILYRTGTVKDQVDGLVLESKSVNIWLTPDDKISVYKLSPGEKVVVYNEKGDYWFLAPKADTTHSGYLMKNYVSFE